MENSKLDSDPCFSSAKNPVLGLESPAPSVLYRYENPVPGTGACSYMDSELTSVEGTISNVLATPLIPLVNVNMGRSVLLLLTMYTSVLIPPMLSASFGLPKVCPDTLAAFSMFMNCSLELALVASFHATVMLARLLPPLSLTSCVVLTEVNLSRPVAGRFLLAL